jgi:hypothetical protein
MSGFMQETMDSDNGGGAAMDTGAGGSSAMEETVFFGATATAAMDTGAGSTSMDTGAGGGACAGGGSSDFDFMIPPPSSPQSYVQPDFSLSINGYPFIKKFSPKNTKYTKPDFFDSLMKHFKGMREYYFKITFISNDEIGIRPVKPSLEMTEDVKDYIKDQLINSGILAALRNVPVLEPGSTKDLMFAFRCVRYSDPGKSYHQDHCLFIMLNYYHKTNNFVFGSELLLGDNTPSACEHQLMREDVGNSLKTAYATVKKMDHKPIVFRGIYENGSTLVWADPLLKHAVPNQRENIGEDASGKKYMQVTVFGEKRQEIPAIVNICSERLITTDSDIAGNRRLFGIFVYLNTMRPYTEAQLEEQFTLDISTEVPLPLASLDLTEKGLSEFIGKLHTNPGECTTMGGVNFFNRGGKKRRLMRSKTNKNKNKKVSKRKSKHNIYKKTHKAKSRH